MSSINKLRTVPSLKDQLQWIKIHDYSPLKTKLTDKYLVKQWVADRIDEEIAKQHVLKEQGDPQAIQKLDILGTQTKGSDYVIPLLGVWIRADDIDFDSIPEPYLLKCNHGCRFNIFVSHTADIDKAEARQRLTKWLNEDYSAHHNEPQYTNIPRRIFAEKLLWNMSNCFFWCTSGVPRFVCVYSNVQGRTHYDVYDMDFKKQPFTVNGVPATDHDPVIAFQRMKLIAEWLCQGFTLVRVDLYDYQGQVLFGEMTFTPGAGYIEIRPIEYENAFVETINLGQMSDL